MPRLLEKTASLCPTCLKALPAEIWELDDEAGVVVLNRVCDEHGAFSTVIWRGEPSFQAWRRPKKPLKVKAQTAKNLGCPLDCGLCPDHGQNPCTVLLELTDRCDLGCPVCFANSGTTAGFDQPFDKLLTALTWIHKTAGQVVLQLSGGEPTLYPRLPAIVAAARKLFPAVQLNTNGLSLAQDPDLAQALAQNGLSWVFLQFDGLKDETYVALRGRPLLAAKLKAILACEKAGLAVVLVPTVAKGVNDQELADLVEWARLRPIIRGIHVQPLTQTGRQGLSGEEYRLTLPETIKALGAGPTGFLRPSWAFPPGCEHERCSFHFRFRRLSDGRLIPKVPQSDDCGCGPLGCPPKATTKPTTPLETDLNRTKAVEVIIQSWGGPKSAAAVSSPGQEPLGSNSLNAPQKSPAVAIPMAKKTQTLDDFLAQATRETFSVTGMVFQDRHNMDLARLKGCCVHIYQEPQRLIPFCAMNLTAANGRGPYRG
ncbi:MAG: radical SAM protein [Deltaproteobacteria bacterium]|jgi:uncharacterized radical SAM superfamily Fe-S cluster-containing enzyme|nr:radical SAM protein [Deltaproteobacteria bacterium]